jgi:hypothetical protein
MIWFPAVEKEREHVGTTPPTIAVGPQMGVAGVVDAKSK